MAYRLFATRPSGRNTVTFIWNGALAPGETITSENNRFRKSGHLAIVTGGGSVTEAEENVEGSVELNFRVGDRLLYTNDPDIDSPLTITFDPAVRRAGAKISAGMGFGVNEFQFVAVVSVGTAAGDHTFEKVCTSRTPRDNSASFVGVVSDDTSEPIEWISFDVRKMPRTRREILRYGINQLTVLKV